MSRTHCTQLFKHPDTNITFDLNSKSDSEWSSLDVNKLAKPVSTTANYSNCAHLLSKLPVTMLGYSINIY